MTKKQTVILASAGLIAATVIWGFAFVVVKASLDSVPPLYMMAFRFTIASILLCAVFARKLARTTRKECFHGFFIGIFLFLAYVFQTIGCKYTTAGKNAFLTTVYVILVPFLNWLIAKRKPDIFSICAAFVSITGIGLLSLRGDFTVNKGDVLTLFCGVCYALQIVYIARYSADEDPITLTVLQIVCTAVLSWIAAPFADGPLHAGFLTKDTVLSMLYLGVFSTLIAYLLQNVCQKYVPPTMTALLMSFESVFGVLFGMIFLHEVLSFRNAIGCLLMFAAVIIGETKLQYLHLPVHFRRQPR